MGSSVVAPLIVEVLKYGIVGIVALIGWGLAGWFLWRDYRKKEDYGSKTTAFAESLGAIQGQHSKSMLSLQEKLFNDKSDLSKELVRMKDDYADKIEELQEKRIQDVKEISEDYNDVATKTIHTLDKLTATLHVRQTGVNDG